MRIIESIKNIFCPIKFTKRLLNKARRTLFNRCYDSVFYLVKEGSLVVGLDEFGGLFEFDVRSHILGRILKTRQYEPDLVKIIKQHIDPSRDAIDIGANIGLFTILLAKLLGSERHVLAVEPTPHANGYLRRNIRRNEVCNSIFIFEGIASNNNCPRRLNVIDGKEEYSSLGDITHKKVQDQRHNKIEVVSSTIDDLVEKYNLNPGFIKIDTEGSEYLVVAGAQKTIHKHRPFILSEISETLLTNCGSSSDKLLGLLRNNAYKIVNAYNLHNEVTAPFDGDILAVPQERWPL